MNKNNAAASGKIDKHISEGFWHHNHYQPMVSKRLIIALFVPVVIIGAAVCGFAQSGRVRSSPTPPPGEDAPVRIATEEVKINVLAFDDDGLFVTDVTSDDLVISENNILHQANSVRRIPANVLIVMDTGGEMRSLKSLDQTRKTARAVVSALRAEDSISILQYADKAEVVAEWTKDKNAIMAAIDRTNFGRRSVFVKALDLARDYLTKNPLDNRHLVLITDGTDSVADSAAKSEAMNRLLTTDINIHVLSYSLMETVDIAPRTKSTSNAPPKKAMPDEVAAQLPNGVRQAAQAPKVGPTINLDRELLAKLRERKADLEESGAKLETLADSANGTFIAPDSKEEMLEKAPLIAKFIDAGYVITYTPKFPLGEHGGIRDIMVTSKREGLIVYAKRKLIVEPAKL